MFQTLVLASNNLKKIDEFQVFFRKIPELEIIPQSAFSISDVEETGLTFVENAILKARHAAKHAHLPAIADDSGLEIDALKGAPGIYSARYASTDQEKIQKILDELKDIAESERTARFQSMLVYLRHEKDPTPIICQGTLEGRILFEPAGEQRLTYEPLLYVPEAGCSVGQMTLEEKNRISHRGRAMRQLYEHLKTEHTQCI